MKTETLLLGQCDTKKTALYKINYWRPKWAKSWEIVRIRRYRYSVQPPEWFRNYFEVEVVYKSTKGERNVLR